MIRLALLACLLATPTLATETRGEIKTDTKAESCAYQADVVAAIQQARLDRVKERDVPEAIAATNPTWPENYSVAIPLITPLGI